MSTSARVENRFHRRIIFVRATDRVAKGDFSFFHKESEVMRIQSTGAARTAFLPSATTAFAALTAFAGITAFASTTVLAAEPDFIIAWDTAENPGSFTLDFVDIGVKAVGDITRTQQALKIDGDTGLVSFIYYDQDVNELILPGDISTGALHIEILESVGVSFDADTGEFVTEDLYAVHFEGDLGAFGIESPFVMPGSSSGIIEYSDENSGQLIMAWEGEGFLPNPKDPDNPLRFTYTCDVNNNFADYQEADFFADADVDLGDFAFFQGCFGGADTGYDDPHCELADFDFDGDIDLDDFEVVSDLQTGPAGD